MAYALEKCVDYDAVIHLGDGERDLDSVSALTRGKKVFSVRGNCDFASLLNLNEVFNIGSARFFISHGHYEGVKYGLTEFYFKAKSVGADVALFGHTHEQMHDYEDGLHIMNPGSIREGYYAVVDISPSGIMCNTLRL